MDEISSSRQSTKKAAKGKFSNINFSKNKVRLIAIREFFKKVAKTLFKEKSQEQSKSTSK